MAEEASLGKLVVQIAADVSDLKKGQQQASQSFDKLKKDANSSISETIDQLKSLAVAAAGFLGLTGLVGSVTQAIETMAELDKQAEILGTTVEDLQALRFAAESVGVKFEQLTAIFSRLDEAIRPGSLNETTVALINLGVEVKNTDGQLRRTQDVFNDTIDAIADIADPAKQAALAVQLFGEQGRKLLPLLRQGTVGLEEFRERLEETGGIIGGEATEAARKLSKEWAEASAAGGELATQIAVALLPALARLSSAMRASSDEARTWTDVFGRLFLNQTPAMEKAADEFKKSLEGIGFSTRDAEHYARKFLDGLVGGLYKIEQTNVVLKAMKEVFDGLITIQDVDKRIKEMIESASRAAETIGAWTTSVHRHTEEEEVGNLTLERANELKSRGKMLVEQMLTPLEKLGKLENDLREARQLGFVDEETANRARFAAQLQYIEQNLALAQSLGIVYTVQEQLEQQQLRIASAFQQGAITAEQQGRAMAAAAATANLAYASAATAITGSLARVFEGSKAASVAAAIVSTYEAANRALASPPGPPVSYAYVAAALATGFANVRAILSTNKGSTGTAAAAGAASAGGVSSSRMLTISGLQPEGRYGGGSVLSLIEEINREVQNGANLISTSAIRPRAV